MERLEKKKYTSWVERNIWFDIYLYITLITIHIISSELALMLSLGYMWCDVEHGMHGLKTGLQLFKGTIHWINLSPLTQLTQYVLIVLIQWFVIYLLESSIQPLNSWSLMTEWLQLFEAVATKIF